MQTINLKLVKNQNHIGHCQITYTTKNELGEKLVYCLQENWPGQIRLLRCSQDGEPSHEIKFKSDARVFFEKPIIEPYDSNYAEKLKTLCIQWIENFHQAQNKN
jgi:hypothetical protein